MNAHRSLAFRPVGKTFSEHVSEGFITSAKMILKSARELPFEDLALEHAVWCLTPNLPRLVLGAPEKVSPIGHEHVSHEDHPVAPLRCPARSDRLFTRGSISAKRSIISA